MYFNIRKWYKDTYEPKYNNWPSGLHGRKVVKKGSKYFIEGTDYIVRLDWCSKKEPKELDVDSRYGRWV